MNNKKIVKQHLNPQNIETLNAMQNNYDRMIGSQNVNTLNNYNTQSQQTQPQNFVSNDTKDSSSSIPSNLLPIINLFMSKNGASFQSGNSSNGLFKNMDLNKISEIMNLVKQFQKNNKKNSKIESNKKEEIDISSLTYIDID